MSDLRRIHVMVGVIRDQDRVLIARRPPGVHQGDLWEFPGGKLEARESPRQALDRELLEELDITVLNARPFMAVAHDYPDKRVFLDVWSVTAFAGKPRGREAQQIAWVRLAELGNYSFPDANESIVRALMDEQG